MKFLRGADLLLLLLAGCGGFQPIYEGEPDCGRRDAVHAVRGVACDGSIKVACECDDRSTLECIEGVWTWSHWICEGLGVSN